MGQNVEEEERKRKVCLVSLGRPPISTCKKRDEGGRKRRELQMLSEREEEMNGFG